MSGTPFGFGLPGGEDDPDNPGQGPQNPFAAFMGNPADLGAAFQQLGQMLSYSGGPVNWDLAADTARKSVAAAGDASVTDAQRREVAEAARLAELWLDPATSMPSAGSGALAWSRAEWVDATLPMWKQLVEPVAARVVEAMSQVVPQEMAGFAEGILGMMRQLGGAMFGAQVGQALGSLAGEVLGSTDIGLPLGPAGKTVLLPGNVAEFGSGLGIDAEQVRLYLALREAAHQRLFAHVGWLRGHLLAAVDRYARGISVDMSRLEEAVGRLDPTDPAAVQEALTGGMFTPEQTPEQQAALARLETTLALVEGWVDAVTTDAAAERLDAASALQETMRRRRAGGGPAEHTFATLVGLELRPRRLREAASLWRRLQTERGVEGRDAVWGHPDLLPTSADLDDPESFVAGDQLDLSTLGDTEPPAEPGQEPGTGSGGDEAPGTDGPDGPGTGGPDGPGTGR